MAELSFDPDNIPIHYLWDDEAKGSGYVVAQDIPEPYRSMMSSELVPCAVLELPDKGRAGCSGTR